MLLDIPGYKGFKVSSEGFVYRQGKKLNGEKCRGYLRVGLNDGNGRKMFMAHRVVASVFFNRPDLLSMRAGLPGPKEVCVCHKNDNPSDNRVENLFLGTQKENVYDMHKKCRRKYAFGDDIVNCKLTKEQAIEIYRRRDEETYILAKEFSITPEQVRNIRHKRQWKKVLQNL